MNIVIKRSSGGMVAMYVALEYKKKNLILLLKYLKFQAGD